MFNRAIEVYLQNISAVSMFKFRRGLGDFGVKAPNQIAIWSELLDANTLLLTPNGDTVYTISFLDLKRDGPTVVELPPKMLGLFDDMWMRYIVDGGIAGPDKGQGGKLLFLPPDYKGEVPPERLLRFEVAHLWGVDADARSRSRPEGCFGALPPDEDLSARAKRQSPQTTFLDASGKHIDTIHADDVTFFEELNELVQQRTRGCNRLAGALLPGIDRDRQRPTVLAGQGKPRRAG